MGGASAGAGGLGGDGGAGGQVAVCGNGEVETGEVCDDGNLLACGSCDATCETAQLAPATGTITTPAKGQLEQGGVEDSFTLDDGVNAAVVFVLDGADDGCVMSGVCVSLLTANGASEVATAISAAINDVGSDLLITATGEGAIIELTHDQDGVIGNQATVEDVGAENFEVTGMSGGLGYDCPTGTGCAGPEDCASEVCTSNVCE
jgi:cysteine-rich repeat protein